MRWMTLLHAGTEQRQFVCVGLLSIDLSQKTR